MGAVSGLFDGRNMLAHLPDCEQRTDNQPPLCQGNTCALSLSSDTRVTEACQPSPLGRQPNAFGGRGASHLMLYIPLSDPPPPPKEG